MNINIPCVRKTNNITVNKIKYFKPDSSGEERQYKTKNKQYFFYFRNPDQISLDKQPEYLYRQVKAGEIDGIVTTINDRSQLNTESSENKNNIKILEISPYDNEKWISVNTEKCSNNESAFIIPVSQDAESRLINTLDNIERFSRSHKILFLNALRMPLQYLPHSLQNSRGRFSYLLPALTLAAGVLLGSVVSKDVSWFNSLTACITNPMQCLGKGGQQQSELKMGTNSSNPQKETTQTLQQDNKNIVSSDNNIIRELKTFIGSRSEAEKRAIPPQLLPSDNDEQYISSWLKNQSDNDNRYLTWALLKAWMFKTYGDNTDVKALFENEQDLNSPVPQPYSAVKKVFAIIYPNDCVGDSQCSVALDNDLHQSLSVLFCIHHKVNSPQIPGKVLFTVKGNQPQCETILANYDENKPQILSFIKSLNK